MGRHVDGRPTTDPRSTHGEERAAREEEALERNGSPDSPYPPAGFEPKDAGERWGRELMSIAETVVARLGLTERTDA